MMTTELDADALRAWPLPMPEAGSKDHRGRVLIVAGSVAVPGAALLAANAALRAGAGKLQIATVASAALPLAIAVPEAMVTGLPETEEGGIEDAEGIARLKPKAAQVDAVLIGAGMAEGSATAALTIGLCGEAASAYVLDAAAVHDLRAHVEVIRACGGNVILTPHAGEMAQLLGRSRDAIETDPLQAARKACDLLRCVVVIKGAQTHVVSPDQAWLFKGGGVGLATSGSGDVLAGLITGLLARGAKPAQAALWGVFLHGEAGRRLAEREGTLGYLARDLSAEVPGLMQGLSQNR